eukprot:s4628_g1.t2
MAFRWLSLLLTVVLARNSSAPREHEDFYAFLLHITEGRPDLRQFLVRKMLLHLTTPAWAGVECPAPNRASRRGDGGPAEALEVIALIATPVEAFSWRAMVRKTLEELAVGVTAGCPVDIHARFTVGLPSARQMDQLQLEAETFGDLARLNMTDTFITAGCRMEIWSLPVKYLDLSDRGISIVTPCQNSEKSFLSFAWAVQHFPNADLVFHQDGDTMVDWREAVPRMLRRIFGLLPPARRDIRRLYLGRLCERAPSHLLAGCPGAVEIEPCGAGSLYGFSGDVVRWIVATQNPEVGHRMNYEDLHACRWARRFEEAHHGLDVCGLLRARDFQNAWIHPVKDSRAYMNCFYNRSHGCFANDLGLQRLHFRLPEKVHCGMNERGSRKVGLASLLYDLRRNSRTATRLGPHPFGACGAACSPQTLCDTRASPSGVIRSTGQHRGHS